MWPGNYKVIKFYFWKGVMMDSINSYQCERCVHGIYDQQDDTWNCGAGCIEIYDEANLSCEGKWNY